MPNLLSPGAHFAGLFNDAILSVTGAPVTSSPVTVYQSDGSTVATLYTDQTKGSTTSNPVSTDSFGNLLFYANPGRYVLSFNVGGNITTKNIMLDAWYADATWNYYTSSASVPSPVSGDAVTFTNSSPVTIACPAPVLGARLKITNQGTGSGFSAVTVTNHLSEVIVFKGSGAAGVSLFQLNSLGATATLECQDGVKWTMTSGEQDSWWVALSSLGYANGYVDNAGPIGGGTGAAYRVQGNKMLFAGSIKSGTSNQLMTTNPLPVGYRPSYTGLSTGFTTNGPAAGYLSISTAGAMTVVYGGGIIILDDVYFNVD